MEDGQQQDYQVLGRVGKLEELRCTGERLTGVTVGA
jgi:hypothetical protein